MTKRFAVLFMAATLVAFVLSACQPAPTQPAASTSPDITLDDFIPVIGEVLETGTDYVLIDDMISRGTVRLLLNKDTRYPENGRPEIKVGWLLSGETAMGWAKSLPPQAALRYLNYCKPAVKVTGEVIEAGDGRILIKDKQSADQLALLIGDDTFFAFGSLADIKTGCMLEGYRAEEVMESYPPQARLHAVKSCQ